MVLLEQCVFFVFLLARSDLFQWNHELVKLILDLCSNYNHVIWILSYLRQGICDLFTIKCLALFRAIKILNNHFVCISAWLFLETQRAI